MKLLLSGCLASIAALAQLPPPVPQRPPSFRSDAVANAASFASFPGISPGELVSIFGLNFGSGFDQIGQIDPDTGKLPLSLGGVSVTFDGIPAPLLFVSQEQINLQVPFEVAGRPSVSVVVRFAALASQPARIPVIPAMPGIFTRPSDEPQTFTLQAVALNQDGTENHPDRPARMGSTITIFAAGLGLVVPRARTGEAAPDERQIVVENFDLVIGGVRAIVQFAGLVPGQVGLYQIVATVPFISAPSDVTPVSINTQTTTSQRNVTLAIR